MNCQNGVLDDLFVGVQAGFLVAGYVVYPGEERRGGHCLAGDGFLVWTGGVVCRLAVIVVP